MKMILALCLASMFLIALFWFILRVANAVALIYEGETIFGKIALWSATVVIWAALVFSIWQGRG